MCVWLAAADNLLFYRRYLDLIKIPGVASLHDLLSLVALGVSAYGPYTIDRDYSLDIWSKRDKAIALGVLGGGYCLAYLLHGLKLCKKDDKEWHTRNFYWLNVWEAFVIALGCGAM